MRKNAALKFSVYHHGITQSRCVYNHKKAGKKSVFNGKLSFSPLSDAGLDYKTYAFWKEAVLFRHLMHLLGALSPYDLPAHVLCCCSKAHFIYNKIDIYRATGSFVWQQSTLQSSHRCTLQEVVKCDLQGLSDRSVSVRLHPRFSLHLFHQSSSAESKENIPSNPDNILS